MTEDDVAAVQQNLRTTLLGRPLRYLEVVDSTQEVVRAAAESGTAEGLAVVAGRQTAGRGRAGRTWWSPPGGGLYLSLLLRPTLPAERIPWITMCLALGTAEAVEQVCHLQADIKWPNDLTVKGRKLAGILAEGAFSQGRLDFVVAGLGLNVNMDFSSRPDLADSATSLQTELGRSVDQAKLLLAILERIEAHYLALKQGTSPQPAWVARLATLGQEVEARLSDGRVLIGQAVEVLPDGALRLRLTGGNEEILRAGDVLLRGRQHATAPCPRVRESARGRASEQVFQ